MRRTRLTADMVVDGRVPHALALSPDGRWVAYVVAPVGRAGTHPVGELWVAATDRTAAPRRLASGEAHDAAPRWAADSQRVYFLSDRAERGTAQLHRVGLTGSVVAAVTSWAGGVSGHLPLADPGLVVVIAADEPSAEDRRRERERDDARVWGERVRPDRLRLLEVRTGEVRTPDVFGDRHVVEVTQRPGDGMLAVLTWSTPDVDPGLVEPALHLFDPGTGRARDLGPAAAGASSLVWWSAGADWHLAYLAKTPPTLVGGSAVLALAVPGKGPVPGHRNLTARATGCPVSLVQVDAGPPLALVASGLDTAIRPASGWRPRATPSSCRTRAAAPGTATTSRYAPPARWASTSGPTSSPASTRSSPAASPTPPG